MMGDLGSNLIDLVISDLRAVEAFGSRGCHQKLGPYGVSRHNSGSGGICCFSVYQISINGQFETPRIDAIDSESQYEHFR